MGGSRKKHKYDKIVGPEAMVLTKGDLNEIGDTFRSVTVDIWGYIKEQYQPVLKNVQEGLKELQVQAR